MWKRCNRKYENRKCDLNFFETQNNRKIDQIDGSKFRFTALFPRNFQENNCWPKMSGLIPEISEGLGGVNWSYNWGQLFLIKYAQINCYTIVYFGSVESNNSCNITHIHPRIYTTQNFRNKTVELKRVILFLNILRAKGFWNSNLSHEQISQFII